MTISVRLRTPHVRGKLNIGYVGGVTDRRTRGEVNTRLMLKKYLGGVRDRLVTVRNFCDFIVIFVMLLVLG